MIRDDNVDKQDYTRVFWLIKEELDGGYDTFWIRFCWRANAGWMADEFLKSEKRG